MKDKEIEISFGSIINAIKNNKHVYDKPDRDIEQAKEFNKELFKYINCAYSKDSDKISSIYFKGCKTKEIKEQGVELEKLKNLI